MTDDVEPSARLSARMAAVRLVAEFLGDSVFEPEEGAVMLRAICPHLDETRITGAVALLAESAAAFDTAMDALGEATNEGERARLEGVAATAREHFDGVIGRTSMLALAGSAI